MADEYVSELLRISIAQICQTIGYNAVQTSPLELLQDILHKFLHEFCRDLRRHVEHYNRIEANLDDVCLTLASLNINVYELLEYILNVEPVNYLIDVPKYPLHKESSLNFLKPGSREVLIRPVHIYEHLPPILPSDDYANACFIQQGVSSSLLSRSDDANIDHIELKGHLNLAHIDDTSLKIDIDENSDLKDSKSERLTSFFKTKTNARILDEEGRPTREIGSVMMTTGGFISPAIEGKLPDTHIPDIIEFLEGLDAPPQAPVQRNFTQVRTSRASSAIPPPSVSAIATVHQKLGPEDKSATTSNGIFEQPAASKANLTPTKPHGTILISGDITNVSSSAITVSANMRLAKKHVSVKQSVLPPPLAARILKKAKKKSAMIPFSTSSKLSRSGFFNCSQETVAKSIDMTDKAHRKRMRMLHKLVTPSKVPSSEMQSSSDSIGKMKNLHGLFNTTLFDAIPSNSKRLQMERVLKRQVKHKKKLLRTQLAIQLDDKSVKRFDMQQQQLQQQLQQQQLQQKEAQQQLLQNQQTDSLVDYSKALSSKMVASAKQFSNLLTGIPHLSEKKSTKSPINTALNTQSRKLTKISSTATQNILNSLPEFCNMSSIKTFNKPSPVFGEVPFSNDKDYKDITKIKSPEIKLSTEPDRNKLNIFKKISAKQKISRPLSPSTSATGSTQIFSGNDNQVINLPSGTTITPAPPSSSQHVYAPEDVLLTVEVSNKTHNIEDSRLSLTPYSATSSSFGKSLLPEAFSSDALHKPKKRGRKPGSKNQPKVPDLGHSSVDSQKKTKKLKLQKNIYALPSLHTDNRSEPLNLSHSSASRRDLKSNNPLGVTSTYQTLDQKALHIDTVERKKIKKDVSVPFVNSDEIAAVGMQQNFRDPSKKNLVLPSKEEVDSINRKLLKMDTVLQPAPPLQQFPMLYGLTSSLPKEKSSSPTKNIINTSPGEKHRSQLAKTPSGNIAITGSPLESTMQSALNNFPNLPQNMLSMLPMYSFSPRPGLIPTQGLFPSVLGNFPNKQINPAANMILQGFMPFPGIKQGGGGISRSPGVKSTDKSESEVLEEPSKTDRNYCNVAPLVPESIKQKLSSPSSACSSLISPKQICFGETPKTPQLKHSPTISEITREYIQQKFSGINTPESRSVGSKSIPSTPGGISLNTYDCLIRGGDGVSTNFSTPSNSTGISDISKTRAVSHHSENIKNISNLPTLNVDSPIEVSDDSEEATVSPMTPKGKGIDLLASKHRTNSKPNFLPAPLLTHMDDLFVPIDNTRDHGSNQSHLFSGKNKEVKKKKEKQNKINKITHSMSHSASFEFCISKIGSEGGVGKLAGGADLIPLSVSGVAYSSKSTPTNSLTASTASMSFDVGNREFASNEVFKDDLSVTPTSETYDKRKKLKKVKYGKIKKKKDKKDKTKDKDKYCAKIEKRVKEKDPEKQRDKDVLKKMKKEKKREKQRSIKESVCSPTSFVVPSHNLNPACFDMNVMNLSNLPSFSGSNPQINTTNSSAIPKLTLKLGNCQSPAPFDETKRKQIHKPLSGTTTPATTRESSPELARISPLVTRPPKQKTSIDSSIHFNAMGGVASSGSSNHGSFTSSELFGDKNRSTNTIKQNISKSPIPPAPSSWLTGGTLTASSTLLPQQLLQSSIAQHIHEEPSISASSMGAVPSTSQSIPNIHNSSLVQETNRPSSYIDAEGNRVWICPACGKVDDGSAMIGCDGCDAWYHWVCVGIFVAPKANEDWFCRICIAKKKAIHGIDKKRKRNKKNKISQKAVCAKSL